MAEQLGLELYLDNFPAPTCKKMAGSWPANRSAEARRLAGAGGWFAKYDYFRTARLRLRITPRHPLSRFRTANLGVAPAGAKTDGWRGGSTMRAALLRLKRCRP